MRFIRQSPSRLQRFQECVVAEKIERKASLSLDVPTRWNSTFKMLKTALVYEHAFTKYSKRDPYYNVESAKDNDANRPPNSNDWKLHKKILNFCPISSHKGDDIALVLGKCLDDWGLSSKLYTITVDNAASNSTACTALIADLERHGHFLFCGWEFLHVRCVAHILNLVVWDGLKVVGKSVKL